MSLLKGPCTESLTDTQPGVWQMVRSLGGTRNIPGKTELCSIRVRAGGMATTFPLSSHLLVQSTGRHHLACAEPSHCMANAKSALTGLDWLAPPRVFLRPHHNKLPVVNTLPSNQPHPAFSVSGTFMGGQWLLQPNHSPHISGENVHLPKLQCLLNRSQGSMGSRWAVAGLAVI